MQRSCVEGVECCNATVEVSYGRLRAAELRFKVMSYELRVFFRSVGGRSDASLWSVDECAACISLIKVPSSLERRDAETRSYFFLSLHRD